MNAFFFDKRERKILVELLKKILVLVNKGSINNEKLLVFLHKREKKCL